MLDAYIGEVNVAAVVLTLSVALVLPVQYWLCRREYSLLVRLLPTLIFALGGAVCVYLAYRVTDWDAVFYALFAAYCGILLAADVLGWLLWAVVRVMKRRREGHI